MSRTDNPLTKLFVFAGFFWMAILLVLTLGDYFSRTWMPLASSGRNLRRDFRIPRGATPNAPVCPAPGTSHKVDTGDCWQPKYLNASAASACHKGRGSEARALWIARALPQARLAEIESVPQTRIDERKFKMVVSMQRYSKFTKEEIESRCFYFAHIRIFRLPISTKKYLSMLMTGMGLEYTRSARSTATVKSWKTACANLSSESNSLAILS